LKTVNAWKILNSDAHTSTSKSVAFETILHGCEDSDHSSRNRTIATENTTQESSTQKHPSNTQTKIDKTSVDEVICSQYFGLP
jgi:hypothetical protein